MPARSKPAAAPSANAAVLLVGALGLSRGSVVRGTAKAVADLVDAKSAREATERDVAIAGGQIRDLGDLA